MLSCTNRPDSYTFRVSEAYMNLLRETGVEALMLDFRDLPTEVLLGENYGKYSPLVNGLIHSYISGNQKFIFISPEYNGSYPGLLKLFLDTIHPREWTHKKACLVGVSQGRAGNLRGMEHLTGVLQYLKMHVYYNKLPISAVDKHVREGGEFLTEEQAKTCRDQINGFLKF